MLKLFLDEHISPEVAVGMRRRDGKVTVHSMIDWEGGDFLGQEVSVCLQEAAVHGLTLVTYDCRTIPPLLKSWAEEGRQHAGVIFVDVRTISPADIGGLVEALGRLSKEAGDWDWTNRVYYLRRNSS
jgi:hypothetical protein